jgi:hypothetical protein
LKIARRTEVNARFCALFLCICDRWIVVGLTIASKFAVACTATSSWWHSNNSRGEYSSEMPNFVFKAFIQRTTLYNNALMIAFGSFL